MRHEPLWPPALAMLAIAGLYAALPPNLTWGAPWWLLVAIVSPMIALILIFHRLDNHWVSHFLGYVLNSIVTAAMIFSVALLILEVTQHTVSAQRLMSSAAELWLANILVFASWYWRLDAGGPHERARTSVHTDGAFFFPQMGMTDDARIAAGEADWKPNFIDYLFLAFNTSTAFSPTDVPVLSRWAKVLMMIQAVISLLVIALLAGRAVNIL